MANQNAQDMATEHKNILNAFSRALTREAHVLTQHPDLLWQQLYNRLQWEGKGVKQALAPELTQRSAAGARSWFHNKFRIMESEAFIRLLTGHTKYVHSCAFSPDGCTLASASYDKTVRLWDVNSGEVQAVLKGHTERVYSSVFSPDGYTLVSASGDESVRLWDVHSGEEQALLTGHTSDVRFCTFSPDGRILASASSDKTVRLWDVRSREEQAVLKGHDGEVYSCAFSPDGYTLASASSDKTVRLWDVHSREEQTVLKGHTGKVTFCVFSPDGRILASAGSDKTVRLWDVRSKEEQTVLKGHTGSVTSCVFSPDGRTLASTSWDKTVKLWNVLTGEEQAVFKGHTNWVHFGAFSPNGCTLASASWDGTVRLWDVRSGMKQAVLTGHTEYIHSCTFSPAGRTLASASEDKTIRLWDVHSGEVQAVLKGYTEGVRYCTFSPDGRSLALASESSKFINLLNIRSREVQAVFIGHTGIVTSCVFSPDGRTLASASVDKTVRLWNVRSGAEQVVFIGHTGSIHSCTFSPDGHTLASASEDKTVRLWNVHTEEEQAVLTSHIDSISSCAFSPDGRTLASASRDKTVRLWDVRSGVEQAVFMGHTGIVTSCVFSPDGRILASASADHTLRLWNANNGEPIDTFQCLGIANACAFSPSGKMLAVGDMGGNVYMLELIGFKAGPIIITAAEGKQGLMIRCPACQQDHMVNQEQLGSEMICPTPNCGLRLRLNPFVMKQPEKPALQAKRTAKVPTAPRTTISRKLKSDAPKKLVITRRPGPLSLTNKGLLICGYDDGSFGIWNPGADQPEIIMEANQAPITAVAAAPDGTLSALGSREGMLKIWDLDQQTLLGRFTFPVEISALAVGSDSRVVVGLADGSLGVWDGMSDPSYLDGHDKRITAVAILPNGQIVSGSMDLRVRYWNPDTRKRLESFKGLKTHITVIAAAETDNRLVGGCKDAGVFSWEPGKGTPPIYNTVKIKGTPSQVIAVAVGSHPLVLCGGADGIARLIDLEVKKIIFKREYNVPIIAGALAPDGSQGAVCDERGRVYRFKIEE